ncbi:MAG: hypothetical protein AB1627_13915 [Chloroflexota bacterium]
MTPPDTAGWQHSPARARSAPLHARARDRDEFLHKTTNVNVRGYTMVAYNTIEHDRFFDDPRMLDELSRRLNANPGGADPRRNRRGSRLARIPLEALAKPRGQGLFFETDWVAQQVAAPEIVR